MATQHSPDGPLSHPQHYPPPLRLLTPDARHGVSASERSCPAIYSRTKRQTITDMHSGRVQKEYVRTGDGGWWLALVLEAVCARLGGLIMGG
jgi:hypothetical protein